jgi:hypothetical protein
MQKPPSQDWLGGHQGQYQGEDPGIVIHHELLSSDELKHPLVISQVPVPQPGSAIASLNITSNIKVCLDWMFSSAGKFTLRLTVIKTARNENTVIYFTNLNNIEFL